MSREVAEVCPSTNREAVSRCRDIKKRCRKPLTFDESVHCTSTVVSGQGEVVDGIEWMGVSVQIS